MQNLARRQRGVPKCFLMYDKRKCSSLIFTVKSLTVSPNHQFSSQAKIPRSDMIRQLCRYFIRSPTLSDLDCQDPSPDPYVQFSPLNGTSSSSSSSPSSSKAPFSSRASAITSVVLLTLTSSCILPMTTHTNELELTAANKVIWRLYAQNVFIYSNYPVVKPALSAWYRWVMLFFSLLI